MDGGILVYFQVVVKPHDIKGSPCCITRLLATQLSRDDLCVLSISDFVSMAFALVYIDASHPALRFCHISSCDDVSFWGVRRDARHQTMDGVECELCPKLDCCRLQP